MVFVVRTKNDPLSMADPVRRVIHGIDSAQPVAQVRTLEAVVRVVHDEGRAGVG